MVVQAFKVAEIGNQLDVDVGYENKMTYENKKYSHTVYENKKSKTALKFSV